MTDFINKVVTIILVFVMLILAPLLISYKTDEMVAKKLILNDVNTFIDKVTDSAIIKQSDIDELYLMVNSHGLVVDVTVERMVYALTVNSDEYVYDYVVDRSFDTGGTALNPSDMIRVTVEEVTQSSGRKLTYKLLRVDEGKFKFSLCGMVG